MEFSTTQNRMRHYNHDFNHARYHESLNNVTPAEMYFGRYQEIMDKRAMIKQSTLQQRRRENPTMTICH